MNKEMKHDNMLDTEILILGDQAPQPSPADRPAPAETLTAPAEGAPAPQPSPRHNWLRLAALVLTAGSIAAGVAWWVSHGRKGVVNIYNQQVVTAEAAADSTSVATVTEEGMQGPAFVTTASATVNDIPLNIYTPRGGRMALYVGHRPDTIPGLLCAVQAADVRADVDIPVGDFVQNGTLISHGSSKLGFFAVTSDSIAIGRAAETQLFERAVSENGSFFRQFSLVSGGEVTDDGPKGKSLRRALCLIDGAVAIVECSSRESYHDFAQALADYGATEAISTVGGNALIFWRQQKDAPLQERGKREGLIYKHCNFLIWTE